MIYAYKVRYVDEFNDYEMTTDRGIVAANSYGEAAEKVVDFYGKDNFCSFEELYACEEIFTEEELEDLWS